MLQFGFVHFAFTRIWRLQTEETEKLFRKNLAAEFIGNTGIICVGVEFDAMLADYLHTG